MPHALDKLTIKGFKSIRSLEGFELKNLNVLIGGNGAGKSNFVSFFSFMREAVEGRLNLHVEKKGRADSHLFLGPKITKEIYAHLYFKPTGYKITLEPTVNNSFVFSDEHVDWNQTKTPPVPPASRFIGRGHRESLLKEELKKKTSFAPMLQKVSDLIISWKVYHVHDTSDKAAIRRPHTVRDNEYLRPDAENLAAFLMMLHNEHKNTYEQIRDTVRLVTPFFDDFKFRPKPSNGDEDLVLEWTQKNSDYPFHVSQFSDGTLRFIALTTALLQPDPPSTIIIDEPELGLHPFAIDILAELMQAASKRTQLIIATQSPALVDCFTAEDIIVVNRKDGASCFERLDEKDLSCWLEDYSLGELWHKNVINGSPTHE